MEGNQTNWPKTKNMFSEVLGDRYAERFSKIYYSDLKDKDDLIKRIHEESKVDASLNVEQKTVINPCVLAYNQAPGNSDVSVPIIAFMKNSKPNLFKILNNVARTRRAEQQIQDFVDTTGFVFDTTALFNQFLNILSLAKTMTNPNVGEAHNTAAGFNFMALVQYSRKLDDEHIATKWYILSYLTFIQEISNHIYDREFITTNYSRITSLIKTFNYVLYIAYENAGKVDELKQFLSSITEAHKKSDETEEKIQEDIESSREAVIREQESDLVDNNVSMAKFKELDEKLTKDKEKLNIIEVEV